MSNLKKPIDFKILENELDSALRADELYKLQNDAKLRAIEQRVPSYDHFRDMVSSSQLYSFNFSNHTSLFANKTGASGAPEATGTFGDAKKSRRFLEPLLQQKRRRGDPQKLRSTERQPLR